MPKHVEVCLIWNIEVDDDLGTDEHDQPLELTDEQARLEACETIWRWIVEGELERPQAFTKLVRDLSQNPIYDLVASMQGVVSIDLAEHTDPLNPEGLK